MLRMLRVLACGTAALGLSTSSWAATPSPTKTNITVTLIGEAGHRLVDVQFNVMSGTTPVTRGLITLFVNKKPWKTVQVIGPNPAPGMTTGTAEIRLLLTTGAYEIAGTYSQNSSWEGSSSQSEQIQVPELAQSLLTLQSSRTFNGYSFALATRVRPNISQATVKLNDVVANTTLASTPIKVNESSSTTIQHDLPFTYSPSAILMADLSGNGTEDLVVADGSSRAINIYLRQADGTLTPRQRVPVGAGPIAILAHDLNQDGLTDLIVLNSADGTVSKLLQSPNHPGTWLQDQEPIHVGYAPVAMATGDFNRDGLLDIVVANFADSTLSTLINQSGRPGAFSPAPTIPTGNGPTAIAAGDILGNGVDDLAVASFDGNVSIFSGSPNTPSLLHALPTVANVGAGPRSIVISDLNGDGHQDLVVANSLDGTASILLANPLARGTFTTQSILDGFAFPVGVRSLSIANVPDLAVSDGVSGDITILHNDGFGRFPTRSVFSVGSAQSSAVSAVITGAGTFTLASSDAGLKSVHLIESRWTTQGTLTLTSALDRNTSHRLQAVMTTATGESLVSPIKEIAPAPKKSQSITFPHIGPLSYGDAPLDLAATASSQLPVRFVLKAGGDLQDGRLSPRWAVPTTIEAHQDGNDEFEAAPPVEQTIAVFKNVITIAPDPVVRTFGAPNPPFTGHAEGVAIPAQTYVAYSSASNALTPVGAYEHFPRGIGGVIRDPMILANYYVQSQVGTVTICPAAHISNQNLQASLSGSDSSAVPVSCNTLPPPKPPIAPSHPIRPQPSPKPKPIGPTPPVSSPVPVTPEPGPQPPVITSPPILGAPNPPSMPAAPVLSAPSDLAAIHLIPLPVPIPVKLVKRLSKTENSTLLLSVTKSQVIPGWTSFTITLTCRNSSDVKREVFLGSDGKFFESVHLKAGVPLTTWTKTSHFSQKEIQAKFRGDTECGTSSANDILPTRGETNLLPIQESTAITFVEEDLPSEIFDRPIESEQTYSSAEPVEPAGELLDRSGECGMREVNHPPYPDQSRTFPFR
jgi:hypothetical protein